MRAHRAETHVRDDERWCVVVRADRVARAKKKFGVARNTYVNLRDIMA